MYTLFKVMTMETWADLARHTGNISPGDEPPFFFHRRISRETSCDLQVNYITWSFFEKEGHHMIVIGSGHINSIFLKNMYSIYVLCVLGNDVTRLE